MEEGPDITYDSLEIWAFDQDIGSLVLNITIMIFGTGTSEETEGRPWKSTIGHYHCWHGKVLLFFEFLKWLSLLSIEEVKFVVLTKMEVGLRLIFDIFLNKYSELVILNWHVINVSNFFGLIIYYVGDWRNEGNDGVAVVRLFTRSRWGTYLSCSSLKFCELYELHSFFHSSSNN